MIDREQAVYAVLCRRPSCSFVELLALRAAGESPPARRRRRWLRTTLAERPGTFVLAALVQGIAIGAFLALR